MTMMELAFIVLLTGSVLAWDGPSRGAAASAVVAAGLAIAGLRAAATPLPPGFLAVDGALAAVAVALAITSASLYWRRRAGPMPVLAPATVLAGAAGLAVGSARIVGAAPVGLFAVAVSGVAAVGWALYGIGRVARLPEYRDTGPRVFHRRAAFGLIAGTAAAGLGPHLGIVVCGVIVAAWSAYLLRRTTGGAGLPVGPMLTLSLLAAWWLMATIAGPEGLSIAALPVVPTSPAAERLLAPVFLLAAWATAGLWPLHRQADAALLAPAGALLIARIVIPALPDGLEHWRALAMPLIVAGTGHAALSGRAKGLAVGMAWVGLLGATPGGRLGAALLLGGALVLELSRLAAASRAMRLTVSASAIAAGIGGVVAAEAGLRAEVVYTVLAVAALVAAVGHGSRQAMTASERSTTDPNR